MTEIHTPGMSMQEASGMSMQDMDISLLLHAGAYDSKVTTIRVNRQLYELAREKAREMGISFNKLVNLLLVGFVLGASSVTVQAPPEPPTINMTVELDRRERARAEARAEALRAKAELLMEEADRLFTELQRLENMPAYKKQTMDWWNRRTHCEVELRRLCNDLMKLLDRAYEVGLDTDMVHRIKEYIRCIYKLS